MSKKISFEVRDRCEDLYVREGKTYEEINKETGVSIPQLQRWGQEKKDSNGKVIDSSWSEKRKKHQSQLSKIQAEMRSTVREKILLDLKKQKGRYDRFFDTLAENQIDTQATYAYNSLCKTISDIQKDLDMKADIYRLAPPVMDAFVKFIKKTVKEQSTQEMVFGLIDRFFDEVKPDGV